MAHAACERLAARNHEVLLPKQVIEGVLVAHGGMVPPPADILGRPDPGLVPICRVWLPRVAFGPVVQPRWIRGFIRVPRMNPRIHPTAWRVAGPVGVAGPGGEPGGWEFVDRAAGAGGIGVSDLAPSGPIGPIGPERPGS